MRRKTLVLGGTRYFGKLLVNRLIARGDEVTIATRGLNQDSFGDSVQRLALNREDPTLIKNALAATEWDLVYDQICYSPTEADALCKSLNGNIKRLIFTSTQSVYPTDNLQTEECFNPYTYTIKLGTRADFTYGEGKRLAEAVYFQSASFAIAAVRLPHVLGADDYTGRLNFHIDRIRSETPFVVQNVDALTSFIQAAEAASFLEWIGDQEFAGPINACSIGEISLRTVLEMIEESVGKKALLKTEGSKEDQSPYATKNSRFLDPAKAIKLGFRFSHWKDWLPELVRLFASGR